MKNEQRQAAYSSDCEKHKHSIVHPTEFALGWSCGYEAALAANSQVKCVHEPFEERCVHCGIHFKDGIPVAANSAPGQEPLVSVNERRFKCELCGLPGATPKEK